MTNNQLSQIENLKRLSKQIEVEMSNNGIPYSTRYYRIHLESCLSPSKRKQYNSAMSRALDDAKKKGEKEVNFFEKWKIRFFIISEWIMEDWAERHRLNYLDYNSIDPYSPQDCNIEGVDIDVKTTVGLSRLQAIPLYSRYKDVAEIQVAIKSNSKSPGNPYYTYHDIQGIFDPSSYRHINIELKYLPVLSQLKNPCYFQPLEKYFKLQSRIEHEKRNYDKEVMEHWLHTETLPVKSIDKPNYNLIAIIFSMLESPKQLQSFLEEQLPDIHHDFIPIVLELASKRSIQILPHYLADYLLKKIINKEEINPQSVTHIMFSICFPNSSQILYIQNLLKLVHILPKVRCKWHHEEDIKDMEIKYGTEENIKQGQVEYIPTFQVQCPQDPTKRTTIYTYCWKTYETLIYTKNGLCDSDVCGGITHQWFDYDEESQKYKTICKRYCATHGYSAFMKIKEEEKKAYQNRNSENEISTDDDVPF